jgi:hypothetical protein
VQEVGVRVKRRMNVNRGEYYARKEAPTKEETK